MSKSVTAFVAYAGMNSKFSSYLIRLSEYVSILKFKFKIREKHWPCIAVVIKNANSLILHIVYNKKKDKRRPVSSFSFKIFSLFQTYASIAQLFIPAKQSLN